MTNIAQGRDLCISRSVSRRALIKTLSIAVADDEHDAEHLTVV